MTKERENELVTQTGSIVEGSFPSTEELITGNPFIDVRTEKGAQIIELTEITSANLLPLAIKSEQWLRKFPGLLEAESDVFHRGEVPNFMEYPLDPMFKQIGHFLPKTVDGYIYQVHQESKTLEIPQFGEDFKAAYIAVAFPGIDASKIKVAVELPRIDPPIFWHEPMRGGEKKDLSALIDGFASAIVRLRTDTTVGNPSGRRMDFEDVLDIMSSLSNQRNGLDLKPILERAKDKFAKNTDRVAILAKSVADNFVNDYKGPLSDRQKLQLMTHSLMTIWPALMLVHYKNTYNDPTSKLYRPLLAV